MYNCAKVLYIENFRIIIHFFIPIDFSKNGSLKKLRFAIDELSEIFIHNNAPDEKKTLLQTNICLYG